MIIDNTVIRNELFVINKFKLFLNNEWYSRANQGICEEETDTWPAGRSYPQKYSFETI